MPREAALLLLGIVIGSAVATLFTFGLLQWSKPSTEDLIREYYLTENAVLVSPHSLRVKMMEGASDFVLVDLRSAQEYSQGHIAGAVNIPAYRDPNTTAYDEVDRIVGAFAALPMDKEVIVYCYSTPCMTGRKVGKTLVEHGIYVKHLGIGWNEWRHFWTLWNHEPEWNNTRVEDYVAFGAEAGVPRATSLANHNASGCSAGGEFGC
jgi:rhodanese-related sulfurtransferase